MNDTRTPSIRDTRSLTATDLVVVGGGPAGLAAAIRTAEAGMRVMLVEEHAQLGGKLSGQLHQERNGQWWIGKHLVQDLVARAVRAGVQIRPATVAWSITPEWVVHTTSSRGGEPQAIPARAVLIATGAVEKPMPLPGWTLPGVYTIGGAQVLTNTHRVRPGARALVVGVDPLSLTIARAMALAGVGVNAVVLPPDSVAESDPKHTLRRLAGFSGLAPHAYLRSGGALLRVAPQLAAIAARVLPRAVPLWGIPLRLSTRIVRILGEHAVTGVELERVRPDGAAVAGSRHTVEVDAVCLSRGLLPLADLSASIGLELVYNAHLGARVPIHSATGATLLRGVFLAGNTVGVESAQVSLAQGKIVGGEIMETLGVRPFNTRDAELQQLRQLRAASEFTFEPDIQRGHDDIDALFRRRRQDSHVSV